MKVRKSAVMVSLVTAAAAIACQPAKADVTWAHSGSVSCTGMPTGPLKFLMFSSFSSVRSRLLIKYNLPEEMGLMTPTSGSAALIERFDDDRIIGYESMTKSYVSNPLGEIYRTLFTDNFAEMAPELAKKPTPEFTEEQRQRLGAEIRAVASPLVKRFAQSYFKKIDGTRVFQGITGHGYRMTQLIATNPGPKNPDPVRITTEWWIGDIQQGDEVIFGLQDRKMQMMKESGYPSKSMWSNETGTSTDVRFAHALPAGISNYRTPGTRPTRLRRKPPGAVRHRTVTTERRWCDGNDRGQRPSHDSP